MAQKRSKRPSSPSSHLIDDVNAKIVPITPIYVDEFLKEAEKMKSCFEKGSSGSDFYLEQIYSILSEENEYSLDFISRFKSLGLFDSLIIFFIKSGEFIHTLEKLAMIMSYFIIDDQLLLSKLHNKEFIGAIVQHFDDPKSLNRREFLTLSQFLELLLEENTQIIDVFDNVSLTRFRNLCQEVGHESALCIANFMVEYDSDFCLLEKHCKVFEKYKTGKILPVGYLCKLLKVLTNHIDSGQILPHFVEDFIKNLFLDRERAKEICKEPELIPPMARFFANIVQDLPENILINLDPLFEIVFEGMRCNLDDSELVDSAVSLMRSLSLTGFWAANASDVLTLFNNDWYHNIVPIAFYTLQHSQGSAVELIQIREFLKNLSLSSELDVLREEALIAIKNLEN